MEKFLSLLNNNLFPRKIIEKLIILIFKKNIKTVHMGEGYKDKIFIFLKINFNPTKHDKN